MENSLNLLPGKKYIVIKPFTDYDNIIHKVGETWIYNGTNFLPYEDGLTLHVKSDGVEEVYRLQWRRDAQAHIIENFEDYVEQIKENL